MRHSAHTRWQPEPEDVLRRWVLESLMTFGGEAADLEDGGDDEPEPDDDEDGLPVLSSSCGQN